MNTVVFRDLTLASWIAADHPHSSSINLVATVLLAVRRTVTRRHLRHVLIVISFDEMRLLDTAGPVARVERMQARPKWTIELYLKGDTMSFVHALIWARAS